MAIKLPDPNGGAKPANSPASPNYEAIVRWAIVLVVAVVIAPFIFLAVKGIVGLALAFLVGSIVIQLAPVFTIKLKNYRLKEIKREVRKNPIETLQNAYIESAKRLAQADANIVESDTAIRNFDARNAIFSKRYPEEAPTYAAISQKLHQGLVLLKTRQQTARLALENTRAQIDKANAIYEMAKSAQHAMQLSQPAEQQVFDQIVKDIAFDQVETELHRAFAQLDQALEQHAQSEIPATPRVPAPRKENA